MSASKYPRARAEKALFLFIDFDSNTFVFFCKTNGGQNRQNFS